VFVRNAPKLQTDAFWRAIAKTITHQLGLTLLVVGWLGCMFGLIRTPNTMASRHTKL